MPYQEVILGRYELHFHIDVDTGEPIRMYRWADDVKPEDVLGVDYVDENDVADFTPRYKKGHNPLFVHMCGEAAIKASWIRNQHWATEEDLEGINFKQHPK